MALEPIRLPEQIAQGGPENLKTTSKIEPGPVPLLDPATNKDESELMKPEFYDCPECLNHGVLLTRDAKGALWGKPCRCMAIRRNIRRLDRSGLKEMIGRYTFDNFETPEPWQVKAKQIAMRYAENPSGWFLAAGSVGAGKTHLCTAICAALIEAGMDTRYMLWRDVSAEAKAKVGKDPEGYARIVDPLKDVPALYIDDLFKVGGGEAPKTGDLNFAFEILNTRYNDKGKLTIISTELTLEALLAVDEAIGSRIYERSKDNRLIFNNKPNWRIGEKTHEKK